MKTEPVIKPEPGTGGDNSWKSLPAHQPMKSEGFVKKQGDLDVKLAAIPPYKGPQLTSQNNVSNKPKAKPKPSRASSRHSHNHGYRLVTSISGGRVTFHSGNGRRVRIFGGTSQNNRRQHKHFQRQAPFTGFCFNCGNQGHRQVTCPQNNLALEVDQKYWLAGQGVVGAINRLHCNTVFRRDKSGQVVYCGEETEQKIEGQFTVEVRVQVNGPRTINVFDAQGALFRAFYDNLTNPSSK